MEVIEIAAGRKFPEGPIAMSDGSVILAEIAKGTLSRVSPEGIISIIAELGGGPNGAAIGPDGACFVCNNGGFEWIECRDADQCVLSFLRRGRAGRDAICVMCNFTPVSRHHYRVGVPGGGYWSEILNSDGREYGGSGVGNEGGLPAEETPFHGRPYSLDLTLPPLSVVFLRGKSCP